MNLRTESAIIAGIDEAGRGPLAGPVVAAACVLTADIPVHKLVQDSKQLTPEQRDEAFDWVTMHCNYGIGIGQAEDIDSSGILATTELAMQTAVAQLAEKQKPTYLLVDGRDKFWFDYPHSSVIRGDELEACISAASIIAKVTRDRMMTEYAAKFPGYGFEQHKGYGTPEHIAALQKLGLSDIHRKTFLTNIMNASALGSVA